MSYWSFIDLMYVRRCLFDVSKLFFCGCTRQRTHTPCVDVSALLIIYFNYIHRWINYRRFMNSATPLAYVGQYSDCRPLWNVLTKLSNNKASNKDNRGSHVISWKNLTVMKVFKKWSNCRKSSSYKQQNYGRLHKITVFLETNCIEIGDIFSNID